MKKALIAVAVAVGAFGLYEYSKHKKTSKSAGPQTTGPSSPQPLPPTTQPTPISSPLPFPSTIDVGPLGSTPIDPQTGLPAGFNVPPGMTPPTPADVAAASGDHGNVIGTQPADPNDPSMWSGGSGGGGMVPGGPGVTGLRGATIANPFRSALPARAAMANPFR